VAGILIVGWWFDRAVEERRFATHLFQHNNTTYDPLTDENVQPDADVTHELFFDVLEKEIQKVHNFTDRKVRKLREEER
jgi:hypothetical protein